MSIDKIPVRRHGISQVECYEVFGDELDAIEREGSNVGLDFQACLFCVTFAISFLIALFTTTIESRQTFDVFACLVIVGVILGVVFGIRWHRSRGAFSRLLERIRDRQVGPAGDEDHPLRPSEVAKLPVVAAVESFSISQVDQDHAQSLGSNEAEAKKE